MLFVVSAYVLLRREMSIVFVLEDKRLSCIVFETCSCSYLGICARRIGMHKTDCLLVGIITQLDLFDAAPPEVDILALPVSWCGGAGTFLQSRSVGGVTTLLIRGSDG